MTRQTNNKSSSRIRLVSLMAVGLLSTVIAFLDVASPSLESLETTSVAAHTETSGSSARLDVERETAPVSGLYTTPVGTELHYSMRLSHAMTLQSADPKTADRSRPPLEMRCEGPLVLTILARRPQDILVGCRMPGLSLVVIGDPGERTERWADDISRSLGRGFQVRLNPRGKLLGYQFPDGMTADQRNWARSVTSSFSFVSSGDDRPRWECEEEDTLGRYKVAYRRADDAIVREKTKFTPHGIDPRTPVDVGLECRTRAWFDNEAGWLRRVSLEDRVSWSVKALGLRIQYENRGTLDLEKTLRIPDAHSDWPADWPAGWPAEPTAVWAPVSGHGERSEVLAEQRNQSRLARLEGKTLESLIQELRELLAAGEDRSADYFETLRVLADLIETRPESAASIADMVRTFAVRDELAASLLSTLGMAGGTAAQSALTSVFGDPRLETELRCVATRSMFQIEKPDDALVQTLSRSLENRTRIGELGNTTMLLLGAYAGRVAGRETLVSELLGHEALARRSAAEHAWIEALGNSGDPRVLSVARRYLTSADSGERALGLTAIRRVDNATTLRLLARHASTDDDAGVRAHAVELLGERRDSESAGILHQRARSDRDVDVRRAAILGLSSRLRDDLSVRRGLQSLMEEERDADLRELLRQILS